jgi:hypothetical protein
MVVASGVQSSLRGILARKVKSPLRAQVFFYAHFPQDLLRIYEFANTNNFVNLQTLSVC